MREKKCPNTGLRPFDCRCLGCYPSTHRLKYLGLDAECESIDDIIGAIQDQIDYFPSLKREGYHVEDMGNDFLAIIRPKRDGFYWGRCRSCGYRVEIPVGTQQPSECDNCREVN